MSHAVMVRDAIASEAPDAGLVVDRSLGEDIQQFHLCARHPSLDRLDVTNGGNLVQRRRGNSDRRVVEVSLTDRGRETVSEHRRRRARDIPLFAGLDLDERAHLEALLRKVASNLDTGHSEVDAD